MCYLRSDRSKQKGYYDERNSLYLCALHPLRAEITKRGRFNLSPNPICAFKNNTRDATVISLIQPDPCRPDTPTYQRMRIPSISPRSPHLLLWLFSEPQWYLREKQPTQAIYAKPTRPYYEPLFVTIPVSGN